MTEEQNGQCDDAFVLEDFRSNGRSCFRSVSFVDLPLIGHNHRSIKPGFVFECRPAIEAPDERK